MSRASFWSAPRPVARLLLLCLWASAGSPGCAGDPAVTTSEPTITGSIGEPGTTADPPTTTADPPTTTVGPGATTGTLTSGGTEDATAGETTNTPTSAATDETGETTTGAAGDGGFCQEACTADRDCWIDGVDQGYECTEGRCRPGGKPGECNSDEFCQIVIAAQLLFCESTAECGPGRVCVALDGFSQGSCPPLTDAMGGCPTEAYEAATLPLLEGGEAEVCIYANLFCDKAGGYAPALYCGGIPKPCTSNAECAMYPSQPICAGDGRCVCDSDEHCADAGPYAWCVEGRCACKSDQDCAGLVGADTCVDGLCGCGSAAVCPSETAFDGTQFVCEPL